MQSAKVAPGADAKGHDSDSGDEAAGDAMGSVEKNVYNWIQSTLKRWEEGLAKTDEDTQHGAQFKTEQKTYKTAVKELKPLLKMLKSNSVNPAIVKQMEDISTAAMDGDIQAAGRVYMKLAIGNAAWPVGVKAVSAHVRKGAGNADIQGAHVLDDESARRYTLCLKRLIGVVERYGVDDDSDDGEC